MLHPFTSVCSLCPWSGKRWRPTSGSRCTGPEPGSLTLVSGSLPSLHQLSPTGLEKRLQREFDFSFKDGNDTNHCPTASSASDVLYPKTFKQ